MTCASTVSHQVVACITTVDSCLSKRCSSSVTNLAISWVSQSTTVHNYVKSWNTSCTWYVTRYFTVIYTLFHIKISQEPTIPLELWHDYYSALGERKVGVHRRGAVHPRPPVSDNNHHILLHLHCHIFSVYLSVYNIIHYVRCILCHAKSWILYKGNQAFASVVHIHAWTINEPHLL